jgi:spore maturation protein CgeB
MKTLCVFGEHAYGDPHRGLSYECSNFIPALGRLGHEVVLFDSWNRTGYRDFAELNQRLLETASTEKPEIIFCVLMGYEIWSETFQIMKEQIDAILINWSTDDSWKYEQFSRFVAPNFDLYATTYPSAILRSRKDGHKNFFLTQWAANSENLSQPLAAKLCRYQVSFVGSAYGNRRKWISDLKKRGIDVACFGYGWENGPVQANEIPCIIRESVISLNFGDSGLMLRGIIPYRSRQIKARIFEVPGSGGFLLTDKADGLEAFYSIEKEIAVFDGLDNLVEKIHFYLDRPDTRDMIAEAGFRRTAREHTYESRMQEVLDAAAQSRVSGLKGAIGRKVVTVDEVVQLYQCSFPLKCLRKLVVLLFSLVWGQKRGMRAARRVIYEFSWRFMGKRTFSASGWPGRMFPKE